MKASTNRAVAVVLIVGMMTSVVLAGIVSFYASSSPDGLESVSQEQGFGDTAADSATADSALAGYEVEGISNERLSVGLAGVVGLGITALVAFGLFLLLTARSRPVPTGTADVAQDRPAVDPYG